MSTPEQSSRIPGIDSVVVAVDQSGKQVLLDIDSRPIALVEVEGGEKKERPLQGTFYLARWRPAVGAVFEYLNVNSNATNSGRKPENDIPLLARTALNAALARAIANVQ